MKKIIKNRVYDTATARKIGEWDNMPDIRDFNYCCEVLYCKKNGEYFLHGEGGPRSKYAKSIGLGNWSGSEQIIPLDYDSAREWAEEHLTVEEYEAEFGLPEEDDSQAQLTCTISAQSVALIRQTAQREGVTIAEIVERLAQSLKQA